MTMAFTNHLRETMEASELNNAAKTMLQKKNTNQSLKTFTKVEPRPKFINDELLPYYENTDLELGYVYDCCKALKPLKGIDVNDMQVEFWYKEFIRMGWNKQIFGKQFEVVKRATLYNRIDFENWLSSEITYNEHDFRIAVKQKIDSLIQRGNFLKNQEVVLSEEEKKYAELAEMKKIELEHKNRRYELMESAAEEMRKNYLKGLSEKKRKLADMPLKNKMKIVDDLFGTGIIQGKKDGFEYQVVLHHLEDYADLIGDDYLTNY